MNQRRLIPAESNAQHEPSGAEQPPAAGALRESTALPNRTSV